MYETAPCTWTNTKIIIKINSIQDIWQIFNKYVGYKLLLHKTTLSLTNYLENPNVRFGGYSCSALR